MVNSWLYCSLDRNCRPGTASSARMNNAINPPSEEEDEAGNHVHDADQLVIGRRDQLVDQIALGAHARQGKGASPAKGQPRVPQKPRCLPTSSPAAPCEHSSPYAGIAPRIRHPRRDPPVIPRVASLLPAASQRNPHSEQPEAPVAEARVEHRGDPVAAVVERLVVEAALVDTAPAQIGRRRPRSPAAVVAAATPLRPTRPATRAAAPVGRAGAAAIRRRSVRAALTGSLAALESAWARPGRARRWREPLPPSAPRS